MLQKYSVMNGRIVQGDEGSIQVEVYIMPDEAERSRLINEYEMNEHTIASSIDPDETPRIEFEDNHTAFILKYPKNYSADDNFLFRDLLLNFVNPFVKVFRRNWEDLLDSIQRIWCIFRLEVLNLNNSRF